MNYGNVVQALEWAVEHRHEIQSDAEAGIHLIRRIEKMVVHHGTTADKILEAAEDALSTTKSDNDSSSNKATGIPTAVEIMNSQRKGEFR